MKTQTQPMVALTFDDGPTRLYTPAILDILTQYDSSATFFILGSMAENLGEMLSQEVNRGNEIGIHSYDHVSFADISPQELTIQLLQAQEVIVRSTGYPANLLRPPYGIINEGLAAQIPFPIILWSIDTLDWQSQNPQLIFQHVKDVVQDGDIVLLHDIFETTVEATRLIVPYLIEQGYQLVTVSELAASRGITLEKGKVYSSFPPIAGT
ncbi:MAG: polysaccharide deacetylase family protein [Anaerovoracaceae bacterium]|jgi:peptidoglycan/xylan/chitin deacetylase (PgdA/CDA1 family)